MHHFTAGRFQNLVSGTALNVIQFALGTGKTAGGKIHFFVDAETATGTAICVYDREVVFAGLDDGSTGSPGKQVAVTLLGSNNSCTSGDSIAVAWTGTIASAQGSLSVKSTITGFTPAVHHVYYDIDYFGINDPTYLANPVSVN